MYKVLMILTMALSFAAAAVAAPPHQAPPVPVSPAPAASAPTPAHSRSAHTLTTQDLKVFFAGLVPYALQEGDIAGATISVVKDGRTIFARGYGYADVAEHAPVIADKTLFRIGSTSKLFTWTAVMQLVAAGKIDLDRDVNAYLDFDIPPKFGKPITMRDLMTMTPGFEEVIRDLIVHKIFPLRRYLIRNMPARIYPPGEIVAYSNYGAALAGYIVQRVSGEPFAAYVEEHILKSLKMDDSTFVQPLPDALKPAMSKGYDRASRRHDKPFELVEPAPAGSMSSTAADMAHFMIAELGNGRYDGGPPILPPRALKRMHTRHYAPAPGMNGYDFGFYQENRNGLRIIGHGGDTQYFHTDLHLILGKDVGIFMSFNSAGKHGAAGKVRVALFHKFLDRYFSYSPPPQATVADPKKDAARVAGWYIGTRREESALRLFFVLSQSHVTALPNGMITVSMLNDLSGAPIRWHEVGPLYYRAAGGQAHLKFVVDNDGRIQYWTTDARPPVSLSQRRSGLATLGILKPATTGFVAVLVLTLLIWLGAWVVRRHYRTPLELGPRQYWCRVASRIGAALLLAVVGIWLWVLSLNIFELGWALMAAYVVGVFGILGGLAIVVEGVPRVVRGPGGILVRCGEALLVLCAIYGIWGILAFGLVSFHMGY